MAGTRARQIAPLLFFREFVARKGSFLAHVDVFSSANASNLARSSSVRHENGVVKPAGGCQCAAKLKHMKFAGKCISKLNAFRHAAAIPEAPDAVLPKKVS